MAEKDITEKTLEAFNDVFADIVNGLLFQGRQVIQEYTLTDAQPYSMYKTDGKLHEQERDVAKYWNKTTSSRISVRIKQHLLLLRIDQNSTVPCVAFQKSTWEIILRRLKPRLVTLFVKVL